jgi:aspartate oxidase
MGFSLLCWRDGTCWTVYYEDWTGQEIIRVLLDQVAQREIEIVDNIYITKLLKSTNVGLKRPFN